MPYAKVTHNFPEKSLLTSGQITIAAREGAVDLAEQFIDAIEATAPRDTGRYVASWQDAGNKAGLAPRLLEPIQPGGRRDKFIEALERQVAFWKARFRQFDLYVKWNEESDRTATPRKDGKPRKKKTRTRSHREAVRQRNKFGKRLADAEATLAEALGTESFLIFDAGGFGATGTAENDAVGTGYGFTRGRLQADGTRVGIRKKTTIRTGFQGGAGRIDVLGSRAAITLTSREPHARIVEKQYHTIKMAHAAIRALGGERISKRVAKALRASAADLADIRRVGTGSGSGSAAA